jgi:hypothetical protein
MFSAARCNLPSCPARFSRFNTLGAGVPPPQILPQYKNHPKKSRRDNDMKSVVIDSLRRELLIRNNNKTYPFTVFSQHPFKKGQNSPKIFTPH